MVAVGNAFYSEMNVSYYFFLSSNSSSINIYSSNIHNYSVPENTPESPPLAKPQCQLPRSRLKGVSPEPIFLTLNFPF